MKSYNAANVAKIKEMAKERGISQKFLCDCLGKRRTFLTDVAHNKDKIDPDELVIIADKLNTTIEYLTDQTEQKEKPTVQTDDELDPEIEELLDLLEQMHPDDLKKVIDFAEWLIAKNKPEGV